MQPLVRSLPVSVSLPEPALEEGVERLSFDYSIPVSGPVSPANPLGFNAQSLFTPAQLPLLGQTPLMGSVPSQFLQSPLYGMVLPPFSAKKPVVVSVPLSGFAPAEGASFAAPPLPTSIPPVAMRTPVAPVASSAPAPLASDAPIQPPIPLSFAQGDEEIHPVVSVVSGRPSIPPPPIPSPADSQPGSPLVIPVPSIPSPPASPLVAPLEVPPIPALENPSVIETSNGERDFSRIKIRSTTPLDLGIRVKGNQMSVIIPRNSPLPVEKSRYYKTNKDHPECLRCCIYQGNNSNVKYNSKIGIVNAYDLPVYEGVQNEIRVCFTIDIGGELHVHANLVGCEAEVKVEMLESVVLKKNEIETILEEETRTEQEILEEKKDELCSAIEFQIQDLESRDGGHFSALIAKEQEWLSNNRDTASVDDLMECLNRLRVWRVCWIRVQETGHGTHSFRWLENAFAMCIMSSRSWSRTLFSFASHTISRLFFGFCRF